MAKQLEEVIRVKQFFNHVTVDNWAGYFLVAKTLLCIVECSETPLASLLDVSNTHLPTPSYNNEKCFQYC